MLHQSGWTIGLAVAALAAGSTFAQDGEAGAPEAPSFNWPKYQVQHFKQDYTGLAELSEIPSRDWFDDLKYMPLNEAGDLWLSMGGQVRFRWEAFNNFAFGTPTQTDDGFYFMQRYFLWTDLHVGPNLRFFVEGKSAFTVDRDLPGGRRTLDHDEMDLQNAFGELTIRPGDDESFRLILRGGRQELLYGKQRLISPLDWSNTRRTWDGGLIRAEGEGWSVDAFWTMFAPVKKFDFNDTDDDNDLWGIYGTFNNVADTSVNLDAYFLGQNQKMATGDVDRYTIGGRAFGLLADTGINYDVEGAYQFGDLGALDIDAFFIASELSYTFAENDLQPWIAFGFDYASGDTSPTDTDSGTFNQLFPLGHAFLGFIDIVGRQNNVDLRLSGRVKPTDKLWVKADWHTFWRADDSDALYNAGGGVVRAGGAGTDTFVGMELDLTAGYTFTHHIKALFGYSHFFTGDFIEDTGSDNDIDFLYTQLQFSF